MQLTIRILTPELWSALEDLFGMMLTNAWVCQALTALVKQFYLFMHTSCRSPPVDLRWCCLVSKHC